MILTLLPQIQLSQSVNKVMSVQSLQAWCSNLHGLKGHFPSYCLIFPFTYLWVESTLSWLSVCIIFGEHSFPCLLSCNRSPEDVLEAAWSQYTQNDHELSLLNGVFVLYIKRGMHRDVWKRSVLTIKDSQAGPAGQWVPGRLSGLAGRAWQLLKGALSFEFAQLGVLISNAFSLPVPAASEIRRLEAWLIRACALGCWFFRTWMGSFPDRHDLVCKCWMGLKGNDLLNCACFGPH